MTKAARVAKVANLPWPFQLPIESNWTSWSRLWTPRVHISFAVSFQTKSRRVVCWTPIWSCTNWTATVCWRVFVFVVRVTRPDCCTLSSWTATVFLPPPESRPLKTQRPLASRSWMRSRWTRKITGLVSPRSCSRLVSRFFFRSWKATSFLVILEFI